MIFSRSSPHPAREFSLAELVAKISELEQRRRNAAQDESRASGRDHDDRSGWRQDGDRAFGAEAELTE
jgi:hypothetical protein